MFLNVEQPRLTLSLSQRWQSQIPHAPETGDGASPLPRKVLIIEDEYLVGLNLENCLRDAGFHVIGIAMTAEEGLEMAELEIPDVAIVDIRLAGDRDGIFAATELRRRLGIPSIFATAHANGNARQRARSAQPIAWIEKPYAPHDVVAALKSVLGTER